MAEAMTILPEGGEPGAWNEAVMELGATLCSPRSPGCGICPLEDSCKVNEMVASGAVALVEGYPLAPKPTEWKELELIYGLARAPDSNKVLLVQRLEGWNPGLWEPPSLIGTGEAAEAWKASGAPGSLGEELGVVRHTITRHKITARVYRLAMLKDAIYQDPSLVGLTGLAKKILRRWV